MVNRRFLQAVLRSFGDMGPPTDDAALLRQFVAGGSEAVFAELVRRHGRLVWAVCRQLTQCEADADDAFQATFLVLLKNAGKIREPAKLSAWLYGVANKVCAKARQATKRRTAREHSRATVEGNGAIVPDSAWDRALAAVHEEAARLPETLQLPFVLCCLEGKGVTEAATQLGWKVGTLSARLARAKNAVLARLEVRGLTLGAIAGIGLALPPAAVLAKAASLSRIGAVISVSILQLTQGAIGMSMKSIKLLAATVMLTCGLGFGVGAGWLATAEGQAPQRDPAKSDPRTEVQRLADEVDRLRLDAELAKKQAQADERARVQQGILVDDLAALLAQALTQKQPESYVAKTAKWEYDFVVISDMGPTKFVEFLQDREKRGWEFNGQTTLSHNGKPTGMWTFRRPAQAATGQVINKQGYFRSEQYDKMLNDYFRYLDRDAKPPSAPLNHAKAIEAEIVRLQGKLQLLNEKPGKMEILKSSLPLEPNEFAELLRKMVQKKFPGRTVIFTSSSTGVVIEGDTEVRRWITSVVNRLADPEGEVNKR